LRQTRRRFAGSLLAALGAGMARKSFAATAGELKTDGAKHLVTVKEGLGGGRVLCLANRSQSQMFGAVFVSPSGKVAVVDGGFWPDGENLGTVLRSLGGHVDFWLLTHAHSDHYGALATLLEKPQAGLIIDRIAFAFPEKSWTDKAEPASAQPRERFESALARCADLKVVRLAKGMRFDLGDDWTFDVLNDYYLDLKVPNINDTSLCLSVKAGGLSWLVPGDVAVQTGRRIVRELGTRLRHDVVFMAHHGQQGADKSFYEAVRPKLAIWPTPDWLWENDVGLGPGSGPFHTNYTKCWMQELGVKRNVVLTKDVLFV